MKADRPPGVSAAGGSIPKPAPPQRPPPPTLPGGITLPRGGIPAGGSAEPLAAPLPEAAAGPGKGAAAKPAGPPEAPPEAVRPPARTARLRLRHALVLASFVLCVVLPSLVAAAYLWTRAADQYASKMGFSVRREDANAAADLLGGLTNLSGSSSSDIDILFEFIQSQKLVSEIDRELDLRAIWSRPAGDPVFALRPDASLEDLVDYWNDMVRLSRTKGPGLLEVEVRAFSAEEATAIARLLFRKSAEMINELSAIAREDAIRYAREDLAAAVERLKSAREAVTRFRNLNQIVNPEIDLQGQAGLLATLQAQQAATLIDIDLLRETARPDDPRLVQAERRLEVIEARIAAERRKLGLGEAGEGSAAFADLVGEYERLVVDREFAEKAYVTALATYDAAVAEARRTSRYLAAYMEPTLAETPQYPKRATLLALITLFLFLAWAIAVLIFYSIRDRR